MKMLKKLDAVPFSYAYGLGEFSYHIIGAFVFTTLNYVLTDIAMMGVVLAGAIQISVRALKIVGAPFIGMVIDKYLFRGVSYLPWIRWSSLVYITAFAGLYFLPVLQVSPAAMSIMIAAVYLIAVFADTTFYTSYNGLFPSVSSDSVQRVIASSSKSIAREAAEMTSGVLFPVTVAFVFCITQSDAVSWAVTCAAQAILSLAVITVFNRSYENSGAYREYKPEADAAPPSIDRIFKTAVSNKPLFVIFIVLILYTQRHFLAGPLKIYYYRLVVGNAPLMSIDMTMAGLAGVAVVPFIPVFIKRFRNTMRVYQLGLIGAAAAHFAIFFVGANYILFIALYTISQIFIQLVSVLTLNMFASAVDYGYSKSGLNCSASIMSMYTSGIQISVLIATVLRTMMLKSINYVGGMTVSPEVEQGIMLLMSVFPAAFLLLAGLVTLFFPIRDEP